MLQMAETFTTCKLHGVFQDPILGAENSPLAPFHRRSDLNQVPSMVRGLLRLICDLCPRATSVANQLCVAVDMTEVFQTVLDSDALDIEQVCRALDTGDVPQNLLAKLGKSFYLKCQIAHTNTEVYFKLVRDTGGNQMLTSPRTSGDRSPRGSDGENPGLPKPKDAKKPMFFKKLAFQISLSYNRMRFDACGCMCIKT